MNVDVIEGEAFAGSDMKTATHLQRKKRVTQSVTNVISECCSSFPSHLYLHDSLRGIHRSGILR